jgi:putative heme-binding domain-containing protein
VFAAAVFVARGSLIDAQDHPGQYDRADIEAGSRLYSAQCVGCHGANGDQVVGVDLRRGRFKTVVSDDDLTRILATGRPDAGMPAFTTFQPREVIGVIAFIRAGFDADATAVKVGDVSRGQAVFAGKGGCVACHRAGTKGARTAPDLSDVGAIRSASALQRILVDPSANLQPANRTIRAVTRDGRTVRGRRLNEDTYTVQLIDDQERLVSLVKTDLRSLEFVSSSAMKPVSMILSPDETSDLIAYLLSLKGLP